MNAARKKQLVVRFASTVLITTSLEAKTLAQTEPSIAVAEALFQEARTLAGENKWDDACPKFAESQRLDPKLGTLLNLAHCHEQQGKKATAWAEYTSAASLAHRSGHAEREAFARERIQALVENLAYLQIRIADPPPNLQILIDEQRISAAVLNAPFPIDPGVHVISAVAPGRKRFFTEIDIPSTSTRIVLPIPALDVEETTSPPPPPPQNSQPTPSPAVPVMAPKPKDAPQANAKILAITGFTVSGAGAILGAVTGLVTLSKASEILPNCNGSQCAIGQANNISSANTLANVSNIGFAVSVLGLAGGIAGVMMMPKRTEHANTVSLAPVVAPGLIGIRGTF